MIKIFRLNDYDWVAAKTLEEAIACYKKAYGECDDCIDDPWELGDEELDRVQFNWTDDNDRFVEKMSFRAALTKMIENGDSFPCHFASTEQ